MSIFGVFKIFPEKILWKILDHKQAPICFVYQKLPIVKAGEEKGNQFGIDSDNSSSNLSIFNNPGDVFFGERESFADFFHPGRLTWNITGPENDGFGRFSSFRIGWFKKDTCR